MKKILLSLLLITFTNHLAADQSSIHLTQEESRILAYLSHSYARDRLFYKKFSNEDFLLSLDVLSKAIHVLNEDILMGNVRRQKLFLTIMGLIPLSLAIFFTDAIKQDLNELYAQFESGKFKDITLPFYIIKELSSKTISDEEKQYLQRFSFEDLYFKYTEDPFGRKWVEVPGERFGRFMTQEEVVQWKIANLTVAEKEKINYLALRSAVTNFKTEALCKEALVYMGLAVGALFSGFFFYEAFMHKTEIKRKIKDYKKLYNLLKKEQERCSLA